MYIFFGWGINFYEMESLKLENTSAKFLSTQPFRSIPKQRLPRSPHDALSGARWWLGPQMPLKMGEWHLLSVVGVATDLVSTADKVERTVGRKNYSCKKCPHALFFKYIS